MVPITAVLKPLLLSSLRLLGVSAALVFLLGTPLACWLATRQRKTLLVRILTALGRWIGHLPPYLVGMILFVPVFLLPRRAPLLPFIFPAQADPLKSYILPGLGLVVVGSPMDWAWRMGLPVVTLAIACLPMWMGILRRNLETALRQDYVRLSRAWGLPGGGKLAWTLLRISFPKIVRELALALPSLVSLWLLTEVFWGLSGIGGAYVTALGWDYYGINVLAYPLCFCLFAGLCFVLGLARLLSGELLWAVDPRNRRTSVEIPAPYGRPGVW